VPAGGGLWTPAKIVGPATIGKAGCPRIGGPYEPLSLSPVGRKVGVSNSGVGDVGSAASLGGRALTYCDMTKTADATCPGRGLR